MNNLISRFSLTASIFVMGIMVSSCAKNFSLGNDKETPPVAAAATTSTTVKKPTVDVPAQLNIVAQAAQKTGVVNCLARIDQVSNGLVAGSKLNGLAFFPAPQTPNEYLSSIDFEVKTPKERFYASADFAPREGGCGFTYEKVSYWQNNCKDVQASNFYAPLKYIGIVKESILLLASDATPQLRVFLMPAGKGCVAIQKEVAY